MDGFTAFPRTDPESAVLLAAPAERLIRKRGEQRQRDRMRTWPLPNASSSAFPAASTPPSPPRSCKDAGYDVHALFMRNWEEDDDALLHRGRRPPGRARGSATSSASRCTRELRRRVPRARLPAFPRRVRAPVARPIPTSRAIARSSSACASSMRERLGARLVRHRPLRAHVARRRPRPPAARRAIAAKDQTYFLHTVPRAQLARTLFPIGDLPKAEVRAHRARARAARARQARQHRHLLHRRASVRRIPGAATCPRSRAPSRRPTAGALGTHRGLMYYTLGPATGPRDRRRARRARGAVVRGGQGPRAQRAGGRAGARSPAAAEPAIRHRAGALDRLAGRRPARFACAVKTRYRQADQPCDSRSSGRTARCLVRTRRPQRAVTPGQFAVFYDGDACLGGRCIAARSRGA